MAGDPPGERRGVEFRRGYHEACHPWKTRHTQFTNTFMITTITHHRKAVVAWGIQGCVLAVIGLGQLASVAAEPGVATVPAESGIETGVGVAKLLRDAQEKRRAGQATEALADLRAANVLIKKNLGDGHPDTLPVLDLAGEILLENGQVAEAQNPLRKAVALREQLLADGRDIPPVEYAAALVLLARSQMGAGTYETARDPLVKAVGLFETHVGIGHPSTTAALERLADVHFALGENTAGLAILQQLLDRRTRQRDEAGALEAATTLARAQSWAGQAAQAADPLAAAIATHQRKHGTKTGLPEGLRQLAELQCEAGDLEAARAALERAAAIDRGVSGDGHGATLVDRLLLLKLDAMLGDTAAAVAACRTLMEEDPAKALLQQDDPQAATLCRAAAEVLFTAQEIAPAAELFRKALELDTRLLGADHPDRAADEAGLGRCLVASGDAKAARPLFDHAVAVSSRVRGPFHSDTLALLAEAGACAAQAGDLPAAAAVLKTLLDRKLLRRGDAAESVLCGLADGVASLEERAGDGDRAQATRESLIVLRQQQSGEKPGRVADVCVRLANARQMAGGHAEAIPLYLRAIGILEQSRSADDFEVAAILAPLANSYRAINANEQAEETLVRGLAIWEASVGPDHPVTIAMLKPLAQVRLALGKNDAALPLMTRLLAAYDADPQTPPADTIKLLRKLAQIHEARGEAAIARGYLERAVTSEATQGKTPAAQN